MKHVSQVSCDRDFVGILGQPKGLPNMARPNDEGVAEVTNPLRLSLFEEGGVERNAGHAGAFGCGNTAERSGIIPPLLELTCQQGKLKVGSQRGLRRRSANVGQAVVFRFFLTGCPLQSKRTSPILVEGSRGSVKEWATGSTVDSVTSVVRTGYRIPERTKSIQSHLDPSNRRGVAAPRCPLSNRPKSDSKL